MFTYKRNIKEGAKKSINGQGSLDDKKDVNQNIGSWIWAILSVLVVATYPVFFLYFQNADEAAFSEVVLPLIVFIATGFVFFVLFLLITKNTFKAAIIANITTLVVLNYFIIEKVVQKVFPGLLYWHIIMLFLLILAHIVWFVSHKFTTVLSYTIIIVICAVFGGLILINGITAMPTIVNKIVIEKQNKERKSQEVHLTTQETNLPNIFYMIFDEYSTNDFMQKYYNYDNTAFTNELERIGFNVSYDSHNNSTMSSTVITNYVNLDYVVDDTTPSYIKEQFRYDNKLFNTMENIGYKITGVGSAISAFGMEDDSGEKLFSDAKTADGKTMTHILFGYTMMYPFMSKSYTIEQETIINALTYLKNPKRFSGNMNFVMSYVIFPHEPFYFDANGNVYASPTSNWKDQKYYLGQYIYATKQIREIVNSIVQEDPECIIILQSDHSARASTDETVRFDTSDMRGILNAVYYRGEPFDISGLSGLDTINKVLQDLGIVK